MNNHWRLWVYIIRHKWFVLRAGLKLHVPLWILILHDWDKLLPDEYNGYLLALCSNPGTERPELAVAFSLHQKRNKHHWQCWILTWDYGKTEILPMPDVYRREMLADWRGASRVKSGRDDVQDWYLRNCNNMKLHPDTRKWIEGQLGVYPASMPTTLEAMI